MSHLKDEIVRLCAEAAVNCWNQHAGETIAFFDYTRYDKIKEALEQTLPREIGSQPLKVSPNLTRVLGPLGFRGHDEG